MLCYPSEPGESQPLNATFGTKVSLLSPSLLYKFPLILIPVLYISGEYYCGGCCVKIQALNSIQCTNLQHIRPLQNLFKILFYLALTSKIVKIR